MEIDGRMELLHAGFAEMSGEMGDAKKRTTDRSALLQRRFVDARSFHVHFTFDTADVVSNMERTRKFISSDCAMCLVRTR